MRRCEWTGSNEHNTLLPSIDKIVSSDENCLFKLGNAQETPKGEKSFHCIECPQIEEIAVVADIYGIHICLMVSTTIGHAVSILETVVTT